MGSCALLGWIILLTLQITTPNPLSCLQTTQNPKIRVKLFVIQMPKLQNNNVTVLSRKEIPFVKRRETNIEEPYNFASDGASRPERWKQSMSMCFLHDPPCACLCLIMPLGTMTSPIIIRSNRVDHPFLHHIQTDSPINEYTQKPSTQILHRIITGSSPAHRISPTLLYITGLVISPARMVERFQSRDRKEIFHNFTKP